MKGTRDPENPFVERLLERLKQKEWSLSDLSRAIGDNDVSAVHKIVTRQRNLGELKARQIADALHIPHAEFFAEAGLIEDVSESRGRHEREGGKTEKRGKHFARLISEIEDDAEQERITGLVDAIIRQAISQLKAKGSPHGPKRSRRTHGNGG